MTDQIDRLKELNGALCAEVNDKDRRIRELEAEVERLDGYRRQVGGMQAACNRLKRRCARLEAILAEAHGMIEHEFPPHCYAHIDERMRALGMEVD